MMHKIHLINYHKSTIIFIILIINIAFLAIHIKEGPKLTDSSTATGWLLVSHQ